jgi:integrase
MSDNLVEWLLPYRRSTGTIKWTRNAFDNARDKAGVRWPNDIMRHTYGSYHVAENQDPGKTMLQMGHKNMQTLLDHYVDARTKDDASEFWSITPANAKGAKLIKIKKAS